MDRMDTPTGARGGVECTLNVRERVEEVFTLWYCSEIYWRYASVGTSARLVAFTNPVLIPATSSNGTLCRAGATVLNPGVCLVS